MKILSAGFFIAGMVILIFLGWKAILALIFILLSFRFDRDGIFFPFTKERDDFQKDKKEF